MSSPSIAARLNELPIVRTHRLATVIVGIGVFFDLFDIFLAGVLATVLTREFMLSPVLLQSVLASGFLGMFVGAVGLGAFADRFGRRTAFLINLGPLFRLHAGRRLCAECAAAHRRALHRRNRHRRRAAALRRLSR